jgi:hypothetical protein
MSTLNKTVEATRKPGELVFSMALLMFSIAALYLSSGISGFSSISAPGTLPLLASTILVLSALLITRQTWSLPPTPDASFTSMITPITLINFSLLGLGYVALLTLVGFVLSTLIYLFASILYLHRQGWLLAFFVSLNSLATIYVIFRVTFKVLLPEGAFSL